MNGEGIGGSGLLKLVSLLLQLLAVVLHWLGGSCSSQQQLELPFMLSSRGYSKVWLLALPLPRSCTGKYKNFSGRRGLRSRVADLLRGWAYRLCQRRDTIEEWSVLARTLSRMTSEMATSGCSNRYLLGRMNQEIMTTMSLNDGLGDGWKGGID